jgi:ribosome biogenesis GTPase A
LVFPGYTDLELQVLAGILPIAQLPAIPSSIYYALRYLPLEKILELEHPSKKESQLEDKRTWRAGTRREIPSNTELKWTAMDVLTAFAEKKGWITAKAGRPDVNRAGNSSTYFLSFRCTFTF